MFNDKYCLTQAVMDGTKTMTRRILKAGTPLGNWNETEKHLPYKVGEVVAIAQSYHTLNERGCVAPEWCEHTCECSAGYENKMFVRADLMPHRIRITHVRIERLQDISDEDILLEGVKYYTPSVYGYKNGGYAYQLSNGRLYLFDTPRQAFASLIDKVSGKGIWERNPWVVAYTFERVD